MASGHSVQRVVVIGGGGHAHVVIEILQEMAGVIVEGVLDSGTTATTILGVPVLGGDDQLPRLARDGIACAVPAIGDNVQRREVFDRIVAAGMTPMTAVHPRACISRSATLGRGVVVMANAVVNALSRIGDNTIVNTAASLDHHATIGCDVHIAPGCRLAGNVTVGGGSLLGVGVIVTPGVAIGARVRISAGLTVTRDVADDVRLRRTAALAPATS